MPGTLEDWGKANNPILNQEALEKMADLPEKVLLHDTTLRDGEQTASVMFSKDDKIRIATALSEYGVDRIEIMPAVSQTDFDAAAHLNASGLDAEIVGFCRAVQGDIEKAIDSGCKGVVIELAANPVLLEAFDWSMDRATGMLIDAVNFAKDKGLRATAFFVAITDSPKDFRDTFITKVLEGSNPDSVALPDTFSKLMPDAVFNLVKDVRELSGKSVEIHPHNAFGLGVANALAGVQAGADVVHTCVNGLGEGAGNAALEAVAVDLKLMLGIDMGVNYEKTFELSNMVAELSRMPLQANKPITGSRVFTTEAGIAVDIYNKLDEAGLSLPEELDIATVIGRQKEIVVGKMSGRRSIALKMEELGLPEATSDQLAEILQRTKDKAVEIHYSLSDDQFKEIVADVCG